jgi:predicted HicB family RNase H-like nuclease
MSQKDPQCNLRLEPELKAWLDAKKQATRLSLTWLVNNCIREAMQREKQQPTT